jgi:hypothetical protein
VRTSRLLRLCLAILLLKTVYAQTTTATLFGVVRDSTGAVMPRVRVMATQSSTGVLRFESIGFGNEEREAWIKKMTDHIEVVRGRI